MADDVVTLNSGQIISGQITSENDTQLVIEVSNASQTIFSSKSVSKSHIRSVQRETVEAKQERLAYEAILKYQLNPDQELTAPQCDVVLAVCRKFLEAFPRSEHVETVRLKSDEFASEKEQVEKGLVKFAKRWMTAIQKVAEQDLRVCIEKVQRTQRDLTGLEKQRDVTVSDYANAKLGATQATADYTGTLKKEDQYRHSAAAQRKALCEGQIQQAQELLRNIESKISRARSDLVSAQKEYETAKAKRDKLLITPVPVVKPVTVNNSVIIPTVAVAEARMVKAASAIPLAQPVLPPSQKRLTISVANDNQIRISEQKQKQELAQVQAERDRQALAGKLRQDPLQNMVDPLYATLRLGLVVVAVFILFFGFVAFAANRAKLRNRRAFVARPAETRSRDSRQAADVTRPTVSDSTWHPPAWAVTETRASETRTPVSVLEKLRTIDWYHFEKVVGLVYQSKGYLVTRRGGANPDGGIDLLIEKNGERTAVQCKHWQKWKKGTVGVKEVRELVGAMTHERLSRGVMVTLGFTPDAQRLAVQHSINLVDDMHLSEMIHRLDVVDQRKVKTMLNDTSKHCPKCEAPMKWRAKGWKPFWGCTRFPRCRGRLYEK